MENKRYIFIQNKQKFLPEDLKVGEGHPTPWPGW